MKKCAIIDECPFFNDQMSKTKTAKERENLKIKYCGGGNATCARYIVAQALGFSFYGGVEPRQQRKL